MPTVRTYVVQQENKKPQVMVEECNHSTSTAEPENDKEHHNPRSRCCNPAPQCCLLIKSRHTLNVWTCFVFLVTVLTCLTVISASIWLMVDCRNELQRMHVVLGNTNTKNCTNLGLQVVFACCVVLFAVFGLGCIGRQLTGYAMMIISGVAIFQSAMTLAFDECRSGVKDETLTTFSSSLRACRLGNINPPFELMQNYYAQSSLVEEYMKSGERRSATGRKYNKRKNDRSVHSRPSPSEFLSNGLFEKEMSSLQKEDDYFVKKMMDEMSLWENFEFEDNSGLTCDANSAYISVLARFVSEEEVNNCVRLCNVYQDFCSASSNHGKQEDLTLNANSSSSSISDNEESKLSNKSINEMNLDKTLLEVLTMKENETEPKVIKNEPKEDFDRIVDSCGTKIWDKTRTFCFYDNLVFIPLSMGAPVFYLLLSLAFMYLGHCDKKLKEQEEKTLKELPVNGTLSANLSESALSRRRSTQPKLLNTVRSNSAFSLFFGSKTENKDGESRMTLETPPSRRHSGYDNSNDNSNTTSHLIPKLHVVNERTPSDNREEGNIVYESCSINHACVTSDCHHYLNVTVDVINDSSAATSVSSCTPSSLDQSFLCVPSLSMSSRITSELYISDSD